MQPTTYLDISDEDFSRICRSLELAFEEGRYEDARLAGAALTAVLRGLRRELRDTLLRLRVTSSVGSPA
jgi:hypothetical protein